MEAKQSSTTKARKTFWYALGSFLVGPVFVIGNAVLRPILDPASVNGQPAVGFGGAIASTALSVTALVIGAKAWRAGEKRTWDLWVGMGLAGAITAFWLLLIAGEFIFPH